MPRPARAAAARRRFTPANLIAGLALCFATAGPLSAATLVSGVVYEGGVAPASHAPAPDLRLGDFDATPGNPLLVVAGDVSLWGGVAHRRASRYTDAWAMDFGTGAFEATFNWQNTRSNPFDGLLRVGDARYALGNGGTLHLGTLSGLVQFEVDPRVGIFGPDPDEVATWDLQVTAVPLPAGGWLMLTGLAGLGLMRRRKMRRAQS